MTRVMRNPVALLATALMVAACGSGGEDEGNPIYDQLRKVAAPAIARARKRVEKRMAETIDEEIEKIMK